MWRECKAAFGNRLCTVLVPEKVDKKRPMKSVGGLAEKAASPAQVFARMVDEAR